MKKLGLSPKGIAARASRRCQNSSKGSCLFTYALDIRCPPQTRVGVGLLNKKVLTCTTVDPQRTKLLRLSLAHERIPYLRDIHRALLQSVLAGYGAVQDVTIRNLFNDNCACLSVRSLIV